MLIRGSLLIVDWDSCALCASGFEVILVPSHLELFAIEKSCGTYRVLLSEGAATLDSIELNDCSLISMPKSAN